ncbi:hypothetical protein CLOSTMETH_00487 [[Clostridium] methylpentosum DSM 5476]|uniref:Uncharacterized protein n=1 Tax=[Clostridium] methylpentosum DSM 5476 TaxID=537013 RepID=C0E9I8_9FIRM|nr:hypothetical protein CLOSTMETH_00487 [[Clostridium] methylpentosum DSM 5476]
MGETNPSGARCPHTIKWVRNLSFYASRLLQRPNGVFYYFRNGTHDSLLLDVVSRSHRFG